MEFVIKMFFKAIRSYPKKCSGPFEICLRYYIHGNVCYILLSLSLSLSFFLSLSLIIISLTFSLILPSLSLPPSLSLYQTRSGLICYAYIDLLSNILLVVLRASLYRYISIGLTTCNARLIPQRLGKYNFYNNFTHFSRRYLNWARNSKVRQKCGEC